MQNQALKTADLLWLALIVGGLAIVCAHIVLKNSDQEPENKALQAAENISAQLMSFKLENIQAQNRLGTRQLASSEEELLKDSAKHELGPEGIIGKDPWGQPYHYKFLATDSGQYKFLLVWSLGPDGAPKIDYPSLDLKQASRMLGGIELGDDIGYIRQAPKTL